MAKYEKHLCDACKGINVETVTQEGGHLLHETLSGLRTCAESCGLCQEIFYDFTIFGSASETKEFGDRFPLLFRAVLEGRRIRIRTKTSGETFENTSLTVDVMTLSNDPASSTFPAVRPVPDHTLSLQSLATARAWIDDCVSVHDHSRSDRAATLPAPHIMKYAKRMIRLVAEHSTIQARLVDPAQSQRPYVALSYCWGVSGNHAHWRTTQANVHSRHNDLVCQDLPATLRDALLITRGLGLSDLWIDAICIVQDDQEEWRREAGKMASIYSRAHVVLAAVSSPSSTSGMRNDQSISHWDAISARHWDVSCRLTDGRQSTIRLVPRKTFQSPPMDKLFKPEVDDSLLHTRAWVLQEQRLSPRTLCFAQSQLFWDCPAKVASEDDYLPDALDDVDLESRHPMHLFSGQRHDTEDVNEQLPVDRTNRSAALHARDEEASRYGYLWYTSVVEKYTSRQLTNSSDKLVAVGGLAKALSALHPMTYIAGLWKEDLAAGMCWYLNQPGHRSRDYRAPSFSWASCDGPISYLLRIRWGITCTFLVGIFGTDITYRDANRSGEVLGCYVQLVGKLITGYITSDKLSLLSGSISSRTVHVFDFPRYEIYPDELDWHARVHPREITEETHRLLSRIEFSETMVSESMAQLPSTLEALGMSATTTRLFSKAGQRSTGWTRRAMRSHDSDEAKENIQIHLLPLVITDPGRTQFLVLRQVADDPSFDFPIYERIGFATCLNGDRLSEAASLCYEEAQPSVITIV